VPFPLDDLDCAIFHRPLHAPNAPDTNPIVSSPIPDLHGVLYVCIRKSPPGRISAIENRKLVGSPALQRFSVRRAHECGGKGYPTRFLTTLRIGRGYGIRASGRPPSCSQRLSPLQVLHNRLLYNGFESGKSRPAHANFRGSREKQH